MSLESDLVSWLGEQPALAPVQGRIFRTEAEYGVGKPFIVMRRATADRMRTLKGTVNPVEAQIDFACWGADAAKAQAVGDALTSIFVTLERSIVLARLAAMIGTTPVRGVRPATQQDFRDEEVREDRDLRAFVFRYDE